MANIELGAIIDAVESTVSSATGIKLTQGYGDLTESIPAGDLPLLQVWARSGRVDPTGDTDRYTLGGSNDPHRHKFITVFVDLYAKPRGASLGEEMAASVSSIDAIMDAMETEDSAPFFGLATDQIKSFSWLWNYDVFDYADAQYSGARFEIEVVVY